MSRVFAYCRVSTTEQVTTSTRPTRDWTPLRRLPSRTAANRPATKIPAWLEIIWWSRKLATPQPIQSAAGAANGFVSPAGAAIQGGV